MDKIHIIESNAFTKECKRLSKKYPSFESDIAQLKENVIANPKLGTAISGKLRKVRFAINSKQKGKSSGGQIIYSDVVIDVETSSVFFVFVYDKSEFSSISDNYIKELVKNEIPQLL
jgi:hypothetical protein